MTERRLDRVLEPAYVADLSSRSDDELRAMKSECLEVETEVSYVRRLAQGRIDILDAERRRRDSGGSVSDLIRQLPSILAGEERPHAPQGRLTTILAPSPSIDWTRGLEKLIGDDTLARLPDLTDDELEDVHERLGQLDTDVSETRRKVHAVIDTLDLELTSRLTG